MTALREVGILGTGSYAPERVLSNRDLEKLVDTNDEWIVTRTGMRERRLVSEGQATSDLACEAAKRAMEDAGVGAGDIDLVILATVTPDHLVPSTACILQARLGLVNASAFDINVACSAFVTGMNVEVVDRGGRLPPRARDRRGNDEFDPQLQGSRFVHPLR